MDSRSIPAGADFAEELLGRLRACSVLVVVIGPRWLTLTDAAGRPRIDDPGDWIRREIAEALSGGLRVIPVLTGDAVLPAEADLPAEIAGLSRRQYLLLRHRYTRPDLEFLVERITEADPELAKVAARRQSSAGRVPQQLPAAVAHFAGRAGELATLTGLLRGRADTGPPVPLFLRLLGLLPFALVGVGGLVGGLIGALGVLANLAVLRMPTRSLAVRTLSVLGILIATVAVWLIVAAAVRSMID